MTTLTVKQEWVKLWQTGFPGSLTSGSMNISVGAGSLLLALFTGWDGTRTIPMPTDNAGTFSPWSSQGNSTQQLLGISGVNVQQFIGLQPNAKGGTHTIQPPTIVDGSGGQNGEYTMFIVEVAGMPANVQVRDLVFTNTASTATTWSQASSTGVPQATDLVIAMTVYENSAAIANASLSDPPTGWTSIGANQDGTNNVPMEACYQILSSGGTQTATWTTADTNKTHHMTIMLTLLTSATSMVVTTDPQSVVTSVGGLCSFTCAVSGATGTAHYDWRINDIAVGTDSPTLYYRASPLDANSRVYCNITDNNGSVTTQTAYLKVVRNRVVTNRRRRQSAGLDNDGMSFIKRGLVDADFFDPSTIGPPSGLTARGVLKEWSGSAWVASKPRKYWNGTTWVSKPAKYWSGVTNSWVTCT